MPVFEYRCRKCKKEFERLVTASAADSQSCPECGGQEVSRLLSLFARSGGGARSSGGGAPGSGGGSCCSGGGCSCH